MSGRTARILSGALVSLTLALWGLAAVFWRLIDAAGVPTPGRIDTVGLLIEVAAATAIFGITGGLIAARRPTNPIGWILSSVAALVALKAAAGVYADFGHYVHAGRVPAWSAVAWLSNWSWIPAVGSFGTFLFLLFPTGRLPSPRWRSVGWLGALAITCASVSTAFGQGALDQFPYLQNPLAAPAWLAPAVGVADAGFVLLPLSIALSAASLWVRARRGTVIERKQIKWVAFAAAFLPIGLGVSIFSERFDAWTAPLVFGPLAAIAVASAIAIRRYRLFDIDRIVSRTVSYVIVLAVLGGVYVGVVVGLGSLLRPLTAGNDLTVALSTLVAAAAFRPLSRRVRALVDRRFNRSGYDAVRTIEAFSSRLRDEIEIDPLLADVESVVRSTMQPAGVSIWLREAEAW